MPCPPTPVANVLAASAMPKVQSSLVGKTPGKRKRLKLVTASEPSASTSCAGVTSGSANKRLKTTQKGTSKNGKQQSNKKKKKKTKQQEQKSSKQTDEAELEPWQAFSEYVATLDQIRLSESKIREFMAKDDQVSSKTATIDLNSENVLKWSDDIRNSVAPLCKRERIHATVSGANPLYGEILPNAMPILRASTVLNLEHARSLLDLGCGLGKLTIQAFLQLPHLDRVIGVEIVQSRFRSAERAATLLPSCWPEDYLMERHDPGSYIRIQRLGPNAAANDRKVVQQSTCVSSMAQTPAMITIGEEAKTKLYESQLEFLRCSAARLIYCISNIDVVFCNIKFENQQSHSQQRPSNNNNAHRQTTMRGSLDSIVQWRRLFHDMKPGSRLLCYERIEFLYLECSARHEHLNSLPFPFTFEGDISLPTSWSPVLASSGSLIKTAGISAVSSVIVGGGGHPFKLYKRV